MLDVAFDVEKFDDDLVLMSPGDSQRGGGANFWRRSNMNSDGGLVQHGRRDSVVTGMTEDQASML